MRISSSSEQATGEIARGRAKVSLTAAARRGAGALLARQIANTLVQLGASIAVARLLVPDEFGVAAMGAAFAGLPRAFGDLGLGAYLIQTDRFDRALYARVFWLNVLVSVGLGITLACLGWIAPLFYGDERVRGVVWVSALGFPLRALWGAHECVMRREMKFARLAALQTGQTALTAVLTVLLAALGFSYWSLVIPSVLVHLAVAPFYWLVSSMPAVPRPAGKPRDGHKLLIFSTYSTGNSLLNYLVYNADYLMIGRMLDAASLGLYTFAYRKAFLLTKRILGVISEVALPVMSSAKSERERLKRGLRRSLALTALVNVPIASFLAAAAPVLIPFVFGVRWTAAVLPFQILLIHAAVNAVTSPIGSVVYAIGRPELTFRVVAPMLPVLLCAYYVGARLGGIVGVAIAIAAVKSIASLVKLQLVLRTLGWRGRDVAARPLAVGALSGLAGLAAWLVRAKTYQLGATLCLALSILAFVVVLCTVLFVWAREELALAWSSIVPPSLRHTGVGAWLNQILAGASSIRT